MGELLNLPHVTLFNKRRLYGFFHKEFNLFLSDSCSYGGRTSSSKLPIFPTFQSSLQGGLDVMGHTRSSMESKAIEYVEGEPDALPPIQTLRLFPKEKLLEKVVMVRFDSNILLRDELDQHSRSVFSAVYTIKYLHEAGAIIVLASNWRKTKSKLLDAQSVANILSCLLQLKVLAIDSISCMLLKKQVPEKTDIFLLENLSDSKEEVANCPKFAELLASGVDIFINDSFSSSHKVLASTVGVPRFCCTSLAGFYFEETLCQLKKAVKTKKKPYMAIIGGGNLYEKEDALQCLASTCNGLIFVGMMSLQILHVLGHYVPPNLLEPGADKPAINIIQLACAKKIPIFCPKDFWCVNNRQPAQMEITSADGMKDGWRPIDLGPLSLDELDPLLTQCKKIICFGPMRFKFSSQYPIGVSRLAKTLDELSQKGCDITIVGNAACNAIAKESAVLSSYHMIENAAVVWEFFRGRRLPGIMALDRAYPFKIDWGSVYEDMTQPLVVDIGSGNGLFLLGMAKGRKDLNFLGLEINKKLVSRCLDSIDQYGIGNGYFIATNATSTFYSLVSSYPGKLEIVSIQCPNPDFKNPKHRWRMLQRSLVEAVIDLLAPDGKVFLQSDVLGVALRMVKLFLKYGKDKLIQEVWLQENPFGVRSDWEQHVIDRGDPMYRIMLMK